MAGNATPQFTKNGKIGSTRVTAANTSSQGGGTIGTDIFLVITAGADGTYIDYVRCMPTATAPTTTTGSVMRLFASTQSAGATTSANTYLIAEIPIPAIAADNATANVNGVDIPCGFRLPAGYSLLATNHAAPAANTAWIATAFGGDY